MRKKPSQKGFTLIESLVAVTLLTVAIVAPMSLTTQSLSASYYSRDQMIASQLAQEAIESVRHVRDATILSIALGGAGSGLPPTDGSPFTIDARDDQVSVCATGICPPLLLVDGIYGYGSGGSVVSTAFVRTVRLTPVSGNADEYKIEVTMTWKTASKQKTFVISENIYFWVSAGSGAL